MQCARRRRSTSRTERQVWPPISKLAVSAWRKSWIFSGPERRLSTANSAGVRPRSSRRAKRVLKLLTPRKWRARETPHRTILMSSGPGRHGREHPGGARLVLHDQASAFPPDRQPRWIFRLRRHARLRLLPAVRRRLGALPAVHHPTLAASCGRRCVPCRCAPPSRGPARRGPLRLGDRPYRGGRSRSCRTPRVAPAYPCRSASGLRPGARSPALGLRPDRGAAPRPARVGRVRGRGLDAALRQHLLELALVALHEDRVLERVLAELLDLLEVFPQHLELLDAGHEFAGRRTPYGFWEGPQAHELTSTTTGSNLTRQTGSGSPGRATSQARLRSASISSVAAGFATAALSTSPRSTTAGPAPVLRASSGRSASVPRSTRRSGSVALSTRASGVSFGLPRLINSALIASASPAPM